MNSSYKNLQQMFPLKNFWLRGGEGINAALIVICPPLSLYSIVSSDFSCICLSDLRKIGTCLCVVFRLCRSSGMFSFIFLVKAMQRPLKHIKLMIYMSYKQLEWFRVKLSFIWFFEPYLEFRKSSSLKISYHKKFLSFQTFF